MTAVKQPAIALRLGGCGWLVNAVRDIRKQVTSVLLADNFEISQRSKELFADARCSGALPRLIPNTPNQ